MDQAGFGDSRTWVQIWKICARPMLTMRELQVIVVQIQPYAEVPDIYEIIYFNLTTWDFDCQNWRISTVLPFSVAQCPS